MFKNFEKHFLLSFIKVKFKALNKYVEKTSYTANNCIIV